jgi:hypothetical protein
MRDSQPVLLRLPEIDFIDDGPGKPIGINEHIGRRPIAAFGNSDGDLQMLQWAKGGGGVRFALIVHHTDAEWPAAGFVDTKIRCFHEAGGGGCNDESLGASLRSRRFA